MTRERTSGSLVVSAAGEPTSRGGSSFTVRNDQFSEVYQGDMGTEVSLPAGLYSVETVAPSGAQLSKLVRVEPGKTVEVALDEREPRTRKSRSSRSRSDELPAPPPADAPVSVDGGSGWVSAATPTGWSFTADDRLVEVPVVRIVRGSSAWEISLPINPPSAGSAGDCTLDLLDPLPDESVLPVTVGFAPERGLVGLIDGLLTHNTISSDTRILDEATDLLRGKEGDPTAAALGGLTLHRLGLLYERASWVENLAEGYPWLVDGRILLAALMREDPDIRGRMQGLRLLLDAAHERPLYADGLSLALELLRRWPDEDAPDESRATGIEALGTLAAYADWSSVSLVTRVP